MVHKIGLQSSPKIFFLSLVAHGRSVLPVKCGNTLCLPRAILEAATNAKDNTNELMLAIRSIHRRVRMYEYTEAIETLKCFLLSHMFEYNAWYVDGTMSHSQGMFVIKCLRCFEFPRRFSCNLVVMLSR
jgi:hypothetical protein